MRRDVLAGSEADVTDVDVVAGSDVAANGDVAYSVLGNVHRWRDGADLQLTRDTPFMLNVLPVTDGTNVVYQKKKPQGATATYQIAMSDGKVETPLTQLSEVERHPHSDYEAAGGFVAYTSNDWDGSLQVWRHGPLGDQELTSFETADCQIDALAPDGAVVIVANGRRYLARPGFVLEEIGSALGKAIYRDGRFLVLIGNSVLEVAP